MTERSVEQGTFVIERTYPAAPARVFGAWTTADAKAVWMDDPDYPEDGTPSELDFRVGGHERFGGATPDGKKYSYAAIYFDIVPDNRIVYAYEMYMFDDRMSVSLVTVEIEPADEGTALTYTEHYTFLDGIDKPADREGGTRWMLDNLGSYLATHAGA